MSDNSVKYLDIRTLPLIKSVDYKALLEKYVRLIMDCEGWDYLNHGDFTQEEKKEIKRIHEEWSNE